MSRAFWGAMRRAIRAEAPVTLTHEERLGVLKNLDKDLKMLEGVRASGQWMAEDTAVADTAVLVLKYEIQLAHLLGADGEKMETRLYQKYLTDTRRDLLRRAEVLRDYGHRFGPDFSGPEVA